MFFTRKEPTVAVFVISLINGKIFLGKRNTRPHKGKYGPVGGKLENLEEFSEGLYKNSIKEMNKRERVLREENKETSMEAAVRETCEELFADKSYPQDFSKKDFGEILELGSVVDDKSVKGKRSFCIFYALEVRRRDITLSERELSSLKPLEEISEESIYPNGKLALYFLKFLTGPYRRFIETGMVLERFSLVNDSIPDFKLLEEEENSMKRALLYRRARINGEEEETALREAGYEV